MFLEAMTQANTHPGKIENKKKEKNRRKQNDPQLFPIASVYKGLMKHTILKYGDKHVRKEGGKMIAQQ